MTNPVLRVQDLAIEYSTKRGRVRSLDGVSLDIAPGEVVGVVGESGSGKSTLSAATGGLLANNAERVAGDLLVDGRSVFDCTAGELRALRQSTLGYIFQNPITSLDPTMRIQRQLALATGEGGGDAEKLLHNVGLTDPGRVLHAFPHQLSGGMAQRIAIAMAVARSPKLLLADEPTSALDRSVQRTILDLLVEGSRSSGSALVIFTHDLRSVSQYCDRTIVMYGGRAVESSPTTALFEHPRHPYSRGLLAAAVGVDDRRGEDLRPVPGMPPILTGPSSGCSFAPRCAWAVEVCSEARPDEHVIDGHQVLCTRVEEIEHEQVA